MNKRVADPIDAIHALTTVNPTPLKAALAKKLAVQTERSGAGLSTTKLINLMVGPVATPQRTRKAMTHAAAEYNDSAKQMEDATERMRQAINGLVEAENDASKRAKTAIANAKDVTAQLGDALARVNRILGTDFEQRLAQLERMTDALARLTELERDGTLAPVIAALGGGK